MKAIFTFATCLLLTGYSIAQEKQTAISVNLKTNTDQSPASVDQQWLKEAEKIIREKEYEFRRSAQDYNFFASNPAQRLGFKINAVGYTVSPLQSANTQTPANWEAEMLLLGINKGNHFVIPNRQYNYAQTDSTLAFQYPSFSIEYINNELGLRQNFILNKKMPGDEEVELLLKYKGDLAASVQQNSLQLKDRKDIVRMFYKDLKVWDANQRPLMARMELRGEDVIAILVNDRNAVYPVTIDPVNQSAEWVGSAEGLLPSLVGQLAVDAAYGFTVTGLGDVNGDGIDDVAIGAPTLTDVISGTGSLLGVGAVFIYYGNAGGLSSTPSAMLQPNTCVAGALFGYSVAAGDVNNDGRNDIIVGAPLDNIVVNSTSGKIGKAYVFNGATLSAITTPFLTVQLSGNAIIKDGINLSVNALFGFSVAVTEDLNGDNKKDIIVGAPTYAGIKNDLFGNPTLLDVQSGGAFVFLTNAINNSLSIVKLEPIKSSLLLGLLSGNIDGLLFGYSVDGLGDYNGDGKKDVVVGSPAGIDVSSLSALLNGKLLQGNATVYYGTGAGINANPGATLSATSGGLLTNLTGTIANVANLFGTTVKGLRDVAGKRTGSLVAGAPLGGTLMNVLSLQLKTGTVNLFLKKASSPSGTVSPTQVLSSPRNSNAILGLIQCNLLFGYSIDNTYDLNCDGFADIIVGEPASSGVQLINANIAGGAAYVYLAKPDGTYQTTPSWTLTATVDGFLGVNATSLIGYSVAGVGKIRGSGFSHNYLLVGSPSRTLDFGSGLLDLGNTAGILFSLVAADNGVGKGFLFDGSLCFVLPVKSIALKGTYADGISNLSWSTLQETNSSHFEIERSADGLQFNTIGLKAASGNSSREVKYNFNDVSVNEGNNYYRLKIVDKDGFVEYSNIVLLKVKIDGVHITSTYPNPFNDKLNIVLQSDQAGQAIVQLYDNTGHAVVFYKTKITRGLNNISLDNLAHLSSGIYNIKLSFLGKTISYKLMK